MNTTNTQDPIKLAPDTKEMKVLAAFLAAMHDQSLDGAKMREAMLWSLGLQPAATNTHNAINRAIQLCEWIAETPHQRGSINGLAAQVRHELSDLQPAAASTQGFDAHDMATAAADGFRDGVASTQASEPSAAQLLDAIRRAGFTAVRNTHGVHLMKLGEATAYAAPAQASEPSAAKFKLGDTVRKTKGSQWHGVVVGTYSTELTPEGYAVESSTEKGSVQIYPAAALEAAPARAVEPLTVLYRAMPESCGRTNWTASLFVKGKGDFTLDRSEYPHRVRYEADRVRWLIGELDKEPFILDYDADERTPCHLCGGTGEKDGKPCWGLNFTGTVHHGIPATTPTQAAKVDYCLEKMKPGGCQLHNLHCGYPKCNEVPAEKEQS